MRGLGGPSVAEELDDDEKIDWRKSNGDEDARRRCVRGRGRSMVVARTTRGGDPGTSFEGDPPARGEKARQLSACRRKATTPSSFMIGSLWRGRGEGGGRG